MARPLKEIDWDKVELMMEADCNAMQISTEFRIDHDTFYRRFKEEYGCSFQDYASKFAQCGIANILAKQHQKAMEGNPNMLMYLGKVRAGQRESEPSEKVPDNDLKVMLENLAMENRALKAKLGLNDLREIHNESKTRQELS